MSGPIMLDVAEAAVHAAVGQPQASARPVFDAEWPAGEIRRLGEESR